MTEASQGAAPPGAPRLSPRGRWLALLLLVVAPVVLRMWPIGHGAPRPGYVPDTHYVRNALTMASTKNLVPMGGTASSYPYLIPYVLLPVYGAEYARGRLMGEWQSTDEFGAELFENPWRAHFLARIVTGLISASAALFIFLAARAAGLGAGAWIAGWLAATCLLHLHLSLHERPWAPLTAMMAATAWLSALHARVGKTRHLLGAGIAAALGASMNPAGGGALLMAGLAWAMAPGHPNLRPAQDLQRRVARGFLCVALFAGLALVVGFPFYLRYGELGGTTAAVESLRPGQISFHFGGQQMVLGIRMKTLTGLTQKFLGYDPVILLLGLGGIIGSLRIRALRPAVIFVLAWGAFFMTNHNEHIRYILPVVLLLTLPAGLAAERLLGTAPGKALVVIALALPLVQALRLGYLLRQPDTRAVAEELLGELPEGSLVGVDIYGPVPPQTLRGLKTTRRLRERIGDSLYGREAHRLMMLEAGAPQPTGLPVFGLQDLFEYEARFNSTWIRGAGPKDSEPLQDLGTTALDALRAAGADYILLVDRTPADGIPPPLTDPNPALPLNQGMDPQPKLSPLVLGADPVWRVHPAWRDPRSPEPDGSPVPDAGLPTTLAFPLRDLWRVRRPGPELTLHRLP